MAKKQFKAESKKLLDLMINSIYTNKEIFMRELISNASDALDKLYYRNLQSGNTGIKKNDFFIEIIPDKELTDTENIPLMENIEEYMDKEIRPFAKYAFIDESKTKIGYEISFTKYFYKYQPPRATDEILNDILELDAKLDGVLKELQENE